MSAGTTATSGASAGASPAEHGPFGVAAASTPAATPDPAGVDGILAALEAGRLRAAAPDPAAPGGWALRPDARAAILALFADRATRSWTAAEAFGFSDRAGLPPKDIAGSPDGRAAASAGRPWRIVPGGTAIRAGAHLEPGVVVMPPSYINVGAWVGADTMVDSHVLVGSCAQVGARVHLAAGVIVGGVLEPAGARPVIVEDDAFVGAGCLLLDGVLVGQGAVLGAGVTLTGTSRLYDLVGRRILEGTRDAPLCVPPGAVVVPGTRALAGEFAGLHGLGAQVALIVKHRDARTDARVALEEALR
jgi:2,3,4,5-tetrahydropyridine-2-carboxylate N-succinyltransferase